MQQLQKTEKNKILYSPTKYNLKNGLTKNLLFEILLNPYKKNMRKDRIKHLLINVFKLKTKTKKRG